MHEFADRHTRPAAWAVAVAFVVLYLSWGTTYMAIRIGVHDEKLPPCLFAGLRIGSAGALLLVYLLVRRQPVWLGGSELLWVALSGVLLFVIGNGGLTIAEDKVASGTAAVLGATTPLWIGLIETFWPGGDRLKLRGWFGLLAGLGGVVLLVRSQTVDQAGSTDLWALLLVPAASLAWAIGSLVVRHRRHGRIHLAAACYQMIIGGGALTLAGLAIGEGKQLAEHPVTAGGAAAFFYLLVVGSLVGFVAFNWLLSHVSAALVGTHAYVNPVVAILVGWLLASEALTGSLVVGMVVILVGVALVRGGIRAAPQPVSGERPPGGAVGETPATAVETAEI